MKMAKDMDLPQLLKLEATIWGTDHIGFKFRRYDTDLKSYIRERATLDSLKEIMIKLCAGLLQLKQIGFVHNLLDPKNIVLDYDAKELAIINFAEARVLTDKNKFQVISSQIYDVPNERSYNGDSYNDVYKLGAIYFVAYMRVTQNLKIRNKQKLLK